MRPISLVTMLTEDIFCALPAGSSFFHVDEHHKEEISQGNKVALIDNYLICQISAINVGGRLESSGSF